MVGTSVTSSSSSGGNGGDGFTTYIANPATYSWSNYLNSSTYYSLGTASSGGPLDLTSATFTIECWVYVTNPFDFESIIASAGTNIGSNPNVDWVLRLMANGTVRYDSVSGSSNLTTTSTATINNAAWNHIAVTRSGTSIVVYVNGVGTTGSGYSTTNTNLNIYIGSQGTSGFNDPFGPGYISNLRVVKGSLVYTSNFTPPTAPLTAISGTSLLTCQAPTFTDASSNNYTINLGAGSRSIASQNPFGASYAGGGGGVDNTGGYGYGGMGGGGAGAINSSASGTAGGTNTGGGAGGGQGSGTGAAGGSGVVILAYPSTYPDASSVTNGTKTTSGGFKIYTFLTNGSITF